MEKNLQKNIRYRSTKQPALKVGSWLMLLALPVLLSACGWVDSTGSGGDNGDNVEDQFSPLTSVPAESNGATSDGAAIVDLEATRIVQLIDQSRIRVTPGLADNDIVDWVWTPEATRPTAANCGRSADFDGSLAVSTLASACSSSESCDLQIDSATNSSGRTVFDFAVPALQAPVGLGYRLSAFAADGTVYNEFYSFCAISINEAPQARDDEFTVVRGETRTVRANDMITLLTNDSDDVDVRNQALSIITQPVVEPRLAENFRLLDNGGFIYSAPANVAGGTLFDSFQYALTDGLHTSTGTVTIRIVESNQVPVLVAPLPNLRIVAGQSLDNDPGFDLSQFFQDPDSNSLSFSTRPGSLPVSGNIQLTESGQLTGLPTAEDIGDYTVTVLASDGSSVASDTFTLSILSDPTTASNSSPTINPIEMLVVDQDDRINFQVIAMDDDGDNLVYSLSNDTADFLTINSNNGRIRGNATEAGIFPVTVIVSDSTTSTERMFILQVLSEEDAAQVETEENNAPIVDDINNLVVDSAFDYDVSVFFADPDGDELTFTAISLPPGLTISTSGIITGVVLAANTGPHFIQVTADDGKGGMVTDGFLLTIAP